MLHHALETGQSWAANGIRGWDTELVSPFGAGSAFRADTQEMESTTGTTRATEGAEFGSQHCLEVRERRRGLGAEEAGQTNRGVSGLGLVEDLGKLLAQLRVVVLRHSGGCRRARQGWRETSTGWEWGQGNSRRQGYGRGRPHLRVLWEHL